MTNGEDRQEDKINQGTIHLHQEELDITKTRVQTNEVTIHKEIVTEQRTISIPITREELVIEKKLLSPDSNQIIRIPLSEERIEVTKHPVILENVNYYTNSYDEIQHIEETVKRELLHVDTIGHPIIVNEEADSSSY